MAISLCNACRTCDKENTVVHLAIFEKFQLLFLAFALLGIHKAYRRGLLGVLCFVSE